MRNLGFVRVGCAVPSIKVADCTHNSKEIIQLIDEAHHEDVEVLLFPELAITGYTCGDLFLQRTLIKDAESELLGIVRHSLNKNMLIVIGIAIKCDNQLFNASCLINNGQILGVVPKTYLPNYSEFYEKRWFSSDITRRSSTVTIGEYTVPFGTDLLFQHSKFDDLIIGVEICEDLWVPIPPSSYAALHGATLLLNNSASNELVGKSGYRRQLVQSQSAACIAAYAYCSSGPGESTTDVVYGGHSLITENGSVLAESERFKLGQQLIISDVDIEKLTNDRIHSTGFGEHIAAMGEVKHYRKINFTTKSLTKEIYRHYTPTPFIPRDTTERHQRLEEIFAIQTHGLAKRIQHVGNDHIVLGISGGLDSTLALLVCVKTYDLLGKNRKNIIGITMPGFGTTDRTYNNALNLMTELGITQVEISIREASTLHLKDIDHDINNHNITYENAQARERTQILMDYANKVNGFVVGTGDLSELALGWATYNGDHMSMYAVNNSIPKTLVRHLVSWVADHQVAEAVSDILHDVVDTPVSPELLPPDEDGNIKQKTEDTVGPYELHDFFLYHFMREGFGPVKIFYLAKIAFEDKYDDTTLYGWLRKFYWRFFSQQFKRSCLPDGPKVGSVSLSPRGDWRMPSDASVTVWMAELETLDLDTE